MKYLALTGCILFSLNINHQAVAFIQPEPEVIQRQVIENRIMASVYQTLIQAYPFINTYLGSWPYTELVRLCAAIVLYSYHFQTKPNEPIDPTVHRYYKELHLLFALFPSLYDAAATYFEVFQLSQ
ncbi:MAG: hypothetical protein ACR2PT_06950 [Endozoicomonas sp.]